MSDMPEPRPAAALRPAGQVMTLERLGSLHQSRLSFMRVLLRRLFRDGWHFERTVWDIDADGVGHAVYSAKGARTYSLVVFAHDLPDELRSDRVIAEAWDATFSLFDGVPTSEDIERLRANVPKQEAGRVSERELTLSRANRSVRLWGHVVDALAAGRQPDPAQIASVGYLMRTTAVYGSGKFGAADREVIADRPELNPPFQAELLSVYLIRWFVRDLVEHMATSQGGTSAVRLAPEIARSLGIGNSTGLGMAPFLVNHPQLFNNWIMARETAFARVRALPSATEDEAALFRDLFARSCASVDLWASDHPLQVEKLAALRPDLDRAAAYLAEADLVSGHPWSRLWQWAEAELCIDAQELLISLMLEPYGSLVDDLVFEMADNSGTARIDGAMSLNRLQDILRRGYAWALETNWAERQAQARAWYVSAEKLEPRLGERFDEPIEDYEQPLAPGRDAAALYRALEGWNGAPTVAAFAMAHPEHRSAIRRAQIFHNAPYAEIQGNTIDAALMPIDMLRAKLSFFGAIHFDPRSDRWVRICMYSGAPYPDELASNDPEFSIYPPR
ncbi:MAG: hypothetical protein AAGJ28_05525 [Pseudomonadota bacterium]